MSSVACALGMETNWSGKVGVEPPPPSWFGRSAFKLFPLMWTNTQATERKMAKSEKYLGGSSSCDEVSGLGGPGNAVEHFLHQLLVKFRH